MIPLLARNKARGCDPYRSASMKIGSSIENAGSAKDVPMRINCSKVLNFGQIVLMSTSRTKERDPDLYPPCSKNLVSPRPSARTDPNTWQNSAVVVALSTGM